MSATAYEPRPGLTHRDADWAGLRVLVTGLGVSGFAAADAHCSSGASTSAGIDSGELRRCRGGAGSWNPRRPTAPGAGRGPHRRTSSSPDRPRRASRAGAPDNPVLVAAQQAGIPVWVRSSSRGGCVGGAGAAPWLTVTGTNGKTTVVTMLAQMLRAGKRAIAVGNVGTPILEAVHPETLPDPRR